MLRLCRNCICTCGSAARKHVLRHSRDKKHIDIFWYNFLWKFWLNCLKNNVSFLIFAQMKEAQIKELEELVKMKSSGKLGTYLEISLNFLSRFLSRLLLTLLLIIFQFLFGIIVKEKELCTVCIKNVCDRNRTHVYQAGTMPQTRTQTESTRKFPWKVKYSGFHGTDKVNWLSIYNEFAQNFPRIFRKFHRNIKEISKKISEKWFILGDYIISVCPEATYKAEMIMVHQVSQKRWNFPEYSGIFLELSIFWKSFVVLFPNFPKITLEFVFEWCSWIFCENSCSWNDVRRSQRIFKNPKALIQCARFHPSKPILYVATQTS